MNVVAQNLPTVTQIYITIMLEMENGFYHHYWDHLFINLVLHHEV